MVAAENLWINSETFFDQPDNLMGLASDEVEKNFYALFLVDGSGARLWSLNRMQTPQQLIPLLNEDESLLRTSVLRLNSLVEPDHIYIVTTAECVDFIHAELPEIPRENIISEPFSKNSAPATALGAKMIEKRDPNAIVAILTADHYITHVDEFLEILRVAKNIAQQTDTIVTLGNLPDYPVTGFDYIKRGEKLGEIEDYEYFDAVEFTHKPDMETAKRFVDEGIYDWNSGIYVWSVKRALEEFARQQPEIYSAVERFTQPDNQADEHNKSEFSQNIPHLSLKDAIMEGTQSRVVIPMDVGMVDIENFATLFGLMEQDFHDLGEEEPAFAQSRFMTNDGGKKLALVGIEDVIIVEDEDTFFVCHKDCANEVKSIVEKLREAQHDKYA